MLVQAFSVLAGAPFVVLCGHTRSVPTLLIALTVWGWFKGMHDANIFASLFDVVPTAVQGKAAGLMNMTGWLGGGATAPVVIGYLARSIGLGPAISFAAMAYVAAGILLLIAAGWQKSTEVHPVLIR